MTSSPNPARSTVDLGPTFMKSHFDTPFMAAKALFQTFDMDVVTFTFNNVVVRVESFTSASEAFEQYETDRRNQR